MDERGFTLTELIIALALSSMVLVGVMMVTSSALRAHFEQIRWGQDTTWNLNGVDELVRKFGATNHLQPCYPPPNPVPAYCGASYSYSEARGCIDYSQAMAVAGVPPATPGVIDGNAGNVQWYDFCVSVSTLWEHWGAGCPTGAWPAITCGTSGGNIDAMILGFYPQGYVKGGNPGQPVFTRVDWAGGVNLKYSVGYPSATVNVPIPVTMTMQTGSAMQKSYNVPDCPTGSGKPCD